MKVNEKKSFQINKIRQKPMKRNQWKCKGTKYKGEI